MRVRLALDSDRPVIAQLGRAMVGELTPHLEFDQKRFDTSYDAYMTTANPTVFVIDEGGAPFGFLVALFRDYLACSGFFIEAALFYVQPDMRGTRAAAILFACFNRWADSLHPEEVFAGIGWGGRSLLASRWMRRFGFEPAGQQIMRRRPGISQ